MYKFKIGNEVRLISFGIIYPETRNYVAENNLILGNIYTVEDVIETGRNNEHHWIRIKDFPRWMNARHFILASMSPNIESIFRNRFLELE